MQGADLQSITNPVVRAHAALVGLGTQLCPSAIRLHPPACFKTLGVER
jgi:hypothetical protein